MHDPGMPRTRPPDLERLFRARGTLTAAELGAALGVSQPTVSRLLAAAGPRVVRLGRARATRYAWAREIGRAGQRWPLYRIDPEGRPARLGELRALEGGLFHFEPDRPLPAFLDGEFAHGLFPGLPWFVGDQRPQGFLGRAFARRVAAEIGAPADLQLWQADDVVLALLRHGEDGAGDLVLGEASLGRAMQQVLAPREVLRPDERVRAYPQRAEAVLRGEVIGSSAGGEQPKFVALRLRDERPTPVIVKFSERTTNPAGRRWADLLVCEHIAGQTLRAHGLHAAESELLDADGRVFLESVRFDRTPPLGRRGFVSLAALDAAHYGHGSTAWWRLAPQLHRDGWLSATDAHELALRGWFGALIANTDMHLGNVGLVLADARPLALAPSYDMSPMLLRPAGSGEVVEREYAVVPPMPEHLPAWQTAARLAQDFWTRVAGEPRVSAAVRAFATRARDALVEAIARFG